LEARDGTFWLATDGGVCLFDPDGTPAPYRPNAAKSAARPMFTVYRLGEQVESNYVNNIVEGPDGAIWCATSAGLFRLRRDGKQASAEWVEIGLPRNEPEGQHVSTLTFDAQGRLWAGAISGLFVRQSDGRAERFTMKDGLPANFVQTLHLETNGTLWGGTRYAGLCRLKRSPQRGQPIIERCYSTRDGLAHPQIRNILRASDGRLWVATSGGLNELVQPEPDKPGARAFLTYTTAHGLSDNAIHIVFEDRAGNLWLGTRNNGLMLLPQITRNRFVTWAAADGFRLGYTSKAFGNAAGELCVQSERDQERFFQQFVSAKQRFQTVKPFVAERVSLLGDLRLLPAGMNWKTLLPANLGFQLLYRDARGDLWLTFSGQSNFEISGLQTFRLEKGKPAAINEESFRQALPYVYGEDAAGNVWIGLNHRNDFKSGLIRYADGRFRYFGESDGVPPGTINALHFDRAGRLWSASNENGLARIDDPMAEHPRVKTLTTADGLSSNSILCLTEDAHGNIYAGHNRGVDRIDPSNNGITHFSASDGLAPGAVLASWRDPQNALWFVTAQAVSRLILPAEERAAARPTIFIQNLRVTGATRHGSALGETALPPLKLAAGENNLSLDFIGIDPGGSEKLRYQYRLGGEDAVWSQPAEQRTVDYPRLTPGEYRFAVRAVNALGVASDPPAALRFTIAPPVWQRWWFVLLMTTLFGLGIYALYRYRLAQLLEVERVRTRIATDLHDDIGVNLSLIAMVSELAHQQTPSEEQQMHGWLTLIADTSREMVDSMSDLVWTINPKKDRLEDLTQRMWRQADDLFKTRDIQFKFTASEKAKSIRLGVEMRREVFLIFKESVNNIARHANCTEVEAEFSYEHDWLRLTLRDNGRGFDPKNVPTDSGGGNGLASMRRRAQTLGGKLRIVSSPGRGTITVLRAPVHRRLWERRKAEFWNRLRRKKL
ncbi:MAG TPA: two-component regulator propeller domain-containing protein, partial [Blastocatellia bacterium]|nr:two-component regulator propeller domain-containing protein [Blastocatellia bacterium]